VVFTLALSQMAIAGSAGVKESDVMPNSRAAEGAAVYVIHPLDGQVLNANKPIEVSFGLRGMGVAPAGVVVEKTGHHHLLIDQQELPDLTMPLPASPQVIHFGGGQTQTEIRLARGSHTLQLVLGNQYHIPHNPPLISKKITIIVE
tara:strand:- start:109 stop:546 length:438 start_codon:yes stop_codon:yes gene_type:complete